MAGCIPQQDNRPRPPAGRGPSATPADRPRDGLPAGLAVLSLALPLCGLPAAAQAPGQDRSGALQSLNPEIGVVGDVVGRASEAEPPDDEEDGGIDRFSFREAEIVFGSFVDPFARADFAFVFSDQGDSPEIEEAFITFFNIPGGFRGRAGKFRSKIGRVNLVDRNALPFVTEPEVIRRYFGEEGFARTGVQLSHFIPAGPIFLDLSAEFLEGGRGDEEVLAVSTARSEPTYVTHLRAYGDFTLRSNLEVGLTWLVSQGNQLEVDDPAGGDPVLGPEFRSDVYGADLSYRYRASRFRDLLLRLEAYRVERDLAALAEEGMSRRDGWYLHADYRFHPRWSAGARYDRVEPLTAEIPASERARSYVEGYAAFVTYHQSEFARFRAQYQRTNEINGFENDEFYLQIRFQIGVDRHGLQ